MLCRTNWLAHYGINGQRWGVRRYQNEDRSYTEEGKKRYGQSSDNAFRKMLKNVKDNVTNRYSKFIRKPIDIDKVKERGKLNDREALECSSISVDLFERMSKVEPEITKDIVRSARECGSAMYGLDNRLKQPTSIASKIGSTSKEDDISFEEAAKSLKDVIRYTTISGNNDFTSAYNRIKDDLSSKGYSEVRCKNFFQFYKDGKASHKSVQCVYSDKDGNLFEIQFHTPKSQAAKELKIPIYEARRKAGLSNSEKKELEDQMIELAERVPNPIGVFTIESYG